ncbi:MAG: hypothetical protein JO086_15375 [Acidimicrobiia bacterium]|nr:hypothetical protein [Acidimicrobiia bacterium]
MSAATATAPYPWANFQPPGDARTRLGGRHRLVRFGILLVVIISIAASATSSLTRGNAPPPCRLDAPCAAPPTGPRNLVATVWRSRDLGFEFQYDGDVFEVASQDGRSARLRPKGSNSGVELVVGGVPAGEADPDKALRDRLSELSDQIVGLTPDQNPDTTIVSPSVGYVRGVGGSYRGTINVPQGPSTPVVIAAMAAGDARTTAVVSVVVPLPASGSPERLAELVDAARQEGDLALKTFRWSAPS